MAIKLEVACPVCGVLLPMEMNKQDLDDGDKEFMSVALGIKESYMFVGGIITCKHCKSSVSTRLTVLASQD